MKTRTLMRGTSFLFVSHIFATVFSIKLNGYRIFSDESHVLSIRSRCSSRIMRIIENNVATFEEVCLNSNRQDEMSGKNIAWKKKDRVSDRLCVCSPGNSRIITLQALNTPTTSDDRNNVQPFLRRTHIIHYIRYIYSQLYARA